MNTDKIHKILSKEYDFAEQIEDEIMSDLDKKFKKADEENVENVDKEKPIFRKEKKKIILKKFQPEVTTVPAAAPTELPVTSAIVEGPVIGKRKIIIRR